MIDFNQIQNFSKALFNHTINGFQYVSAEAKNDRLSICNNCENYEKVNKMCNICGCFLEIKTGWASEKCPIDKWGTEITTENLENNIPQNVNQTKDCGCNKNV